jgi:hypothetical protein
MRKSKKSYTILQKASSIFLMLVLFWLTVSTPFIIAGQQELGKERKAMSVDIPDADNDDDRTESSGNNTEEKVPVGGNSLSEEYLHEHLLTKDFGAKTTLNYGLENAVPYIAFHGELHAPPPNVA